MDMEEEKYFVARGMAEFGGGFIRMLGNALHHADANNSRKIKETWADEWKKYLPMGKKAHAEDCV